MDRRSWLWRRKSSEKSPNGETESSGSISSHSERFSDDQASSNHNTHSPEVISKAVPSDEELNESVKTLSEKLSEALVNIRAKEDLVKQHAKVAEEAVSGWERAENEVLVLKKQTEAVTQKNSVLEERVRQLDGALKECLRQLRQAREEQEQKLYDAVAQKSCEWESTKSELENQLIELRSQLQSAKTDVIKLETMEKENAILKRELHSQSEELKLMTCERDLSTRAAESASKQHLDSIKKTAKLEAECRMLKALARKASHANDLHSSTSTVHVEFFADSQSDIVDNLLVIENDNCKINGLKPVDSGFYKPESRVIVAEMGKFKYERPLGRNHMVSSVEIDLMDDFLEMERFASLPETESGSGPETGAEGRDQPLKAELDTMITRTAELEEKLERVEAEKINLEMALKECQKQLKTSQDQLKETQLKLVDLETQLAMVNEAKRLSELEVEAANEKLTKSTNNLEDAKVNLVELKNQLIVANEEKFVIESELKTRNIKKQEVELHVKSLELELEALHSSIGTLEEEIKREKCVSGEAVVRCQTLENEISRMKLDYQLQRSAGIEEFRINQDKELAVAASKFTECQKTIASLSRQLKSLATFDDFLIDSERPV
ncbi:filament-like plant protein 3 [Olea europaea var. sylvestris]|nr:filament-like plant protein 3 [Olea europaea var. sylvestris]XP_022879508.1 filament-like plant protein 3 [Olea europaea var. sylvestris]XP_022879509.1 filament-like plant protein 3 [Olea europaea var. sylvestris]XP_022879510.1 filament-like plant protein 3 [Olea europaea var. sylvestris]